MGCGSSAPAVAEEARDKPGRVSVAVANPASMHRMTMAATGAIDVPPPKSAPGINAAVAAKSPTPSASSSVGSSGGDYVSKTIAAVDDTLELVQEEGKLGFVFPILKEIPARVFAIRGLRVLKLAGNELGSLPAQLCGMRDLEELDVSRCKLTELPDGISQLSSLRELCASENDLTALPASIGRLRQLTKLLLFKNKLTALPEELGSCSALSELNLFNNKIAALPASLSRLTALTDVGLGSNKLATIPDPSRWRECTRLAVQWNTIAVLPDVSALAGTLGTLLVNDNGLTEWPSVGEARKMTLIDASKNKLTAIPAAALRPLVAIVTLNLSSNALRFLPEELGSLACLETLNVSINQLEALPASISGCRSLKAIIASNNRFASLPSALAECPALNRITLDKCPTLTGDDGETVATLKIVKAKCKGGIFRVDAGLGARL